MRFRPCIDIHNGKVKQIVGGSLMDDQDRARENFVSMQDGFFYGDFYRSKGLVGGHVILLNPPSSSHYQATKDQAMKALEAWPGGLQIGGGINPENVEEFLEGGASHVIVTSYVFRDGKISWENLEKMVKAVGKERLVLDLSCRKKKNAYWIVTDRWQKFTNEQITESFVDQLADFCDEFLVHGVDVEGKTSGIEEDLVKLLSEHSKRQITYAGGVGEYRDLEQLRDVGKNRIDVTVGSALDLFGGPLKLERILKICDKI